MIPFLNVKVLRLSKGLFICAGLLVLLVTLHCKIPLQAQSSDDTYQWTYPLTDKLSFATVDALQQVYIATNDGRLIKLNKEGQLLFEYSNKRLGKVGGIDASNPFTVLVYYPELATVILLDRTLSELKTINLFELNIFEPKAVAVSNDNNIWVYDRVNFQIKKISKDGEVLFQSKYLNQILDLSINPSYILERNNQLLMSDPDKGLFIFDGFGQFKQHIQLEDCSQFQTANDQLIYFKKEELYSHILPTGEEIVLQKFPQASQVLLLDNGWLVVESKVINYRLR